MDGIHQIAIGVLAGRAISVRLARTQFRKGIKKHEMLFRAILLTQSFKKGICLISETSAKSYS